MSRTPCMHINQILGTCSCLKFYNSMHVALWLCGELPSQSPYAPLDRVLSHIISNFMQKETQ